MFQGVVKEGRVALSIMVFVVVENPVLSLHRRLSTSWGLEMVC